MSNWAGYGIDLPDLTEEQRDAIFAERELHYAKEDIEEFMAKFLPHDLLVPQELVELCASDLLKSRTWCDEHDTIVEIVCNRLHWYGAKEAIIKC